MASIHVNSSSCPANSICEKCSNDLAHIICIAVIVFCGLLCNFLLLYGVCKSWKKKKSADKVCIFNYCISNIVAIMGGLPLRIVLITYYDDQLMCDMVVKVKSLEECFWVGSTFVSMAMMAVIAFDRFEALTKFPHQRKLNIKKSIIVAAFLWCIALSVGIVLYITFPTLCRFQRDDIQTPAKRGLPRIVKQIVIVLLMGCSCERCARYLTLATKRIHQHRKQINSVLGHSLASVEVSFTKSVLVFCVSNSVLVVPLIAVSVVFGARPDIQMKCFSQWISTMLYLAVVYSPLIYFTVDKRMRVQLVRGWSVKVGERNQISSQTGLSSEKRQTSSQSVQKK